MPDGTVPHSLDRQLYDSCSLRQPLRSAQGAYQLPKLLFLSGTNTSFPRCLDIQTSKHILFRISLFTRHCTGPSIALRRRWGRSGKASGDRMLAKKEMAALDVRMMIS